MENISILTKIYEVVHSYLTGLVTVTLIVGTLNTIGLLVLGIDYAVFFGFLAAALLVIPFIGILIGSILPIIIALITKDSPMYAVGVAGVFVFVQFLEGNFITPQIVGSKVSINGLVAIIALLLGSALWGLAGMALSGVFTPAPRQLAGGPRRVIPGRNRSASRCLAGGRGGRSGPPVPAAGT